MRYWLIPCNVSKYDVISAFSEKNIVNWKQSTNIEIGDFVYIYVSKPISGIMYKCIVTNVNLPILTIDDSKFVIDGKQYENYGRYMELELLFKYIEPISFEFLKSNGFRGNPQSPRVIEEDLINKIEAFQTSFPLEFNDELSEQDLKEGKAIKVLVNAFERNEKARNLAIEYHGSKCFACGFDFYEKYGDLGKGYIQVHHKVPLNKINKEYTVDYKTDLIPLCANCHAMIHRNSKDNMMTVEELIKIIKH